MSLSRVIGMSFVGLTVLGAGVVVGQDYPNKPIRIFTGAVGSGGDFTTRQIAQGISGPLGQPVVVENRPGGVVAPETVSKAPADGYTLLVNGGAFWTLPLLREAPYAVMRDFAPLSLVSREVLILAVHPSLPVRSIKDLIALAKSRPAELNFSAGTIGGAPHLSSELFKSMAGVNIVHVPYKGNSLATTGLVSGEVQMIIMDVVLVSPHVTTGKLRALAVTSAQPSALVPGLPTIAASGLPGYESVGMTGIFLPARTPAPIINRLNQEIVKVLNRQEVKERFLNVGSEVVGTSAEQFAAILQADIAKLGKLIKDNGIKVD